MGHDLFGKRPHTPKSFPLVKARGAEGAADRIDSHRPQYLHPFGYDFRRPDQREYSPVSGTFRSQDPVFIPGVIGRPLLAAKSTLSGLVLAAIWIGTRGF